MIIELPLFEKKDVKMYAVTLCFVVIIWVKNPQRLLKEHELCHVEQWKNQPMTFHFRYFFEMFSNKSRGMSWGDSYRSISYEVEAREKSKRKLLERWSLQ